MNSSNIKVLILSAGAGRRFGYPKALAKFSGETFLDIIVSKCLSLNLETYAIINDEVAQEIYNTKNYTTIIGDARNDMFQSFLKGVKYIGYFSSLLVWPVDHPFVTPKTIETLLKFADKSQAIIPSYDNRLGHPILIPECSREYLAISKNLKDLTQKCGRLFISVDDQEILRNINIKENLPTNE